MVPRAESPGALLSNEGVAFDPRRWRRRLVSVPAVLLAAALAVALLPLLLPLAAAVDLARGSRLAAARSLLFVTLFLLCESAGIVISALIWLAARGPERSMEANHQLQRRWSQALAWGLRVFFGARYALEGDAPPERGPALLLVRHASSADTLLPMSLAAIPADLRVRYVLKKELLADPCLDIVGHRLPNVFVDRARGGPWEIAAVGRLVAGMGPRDVGVIFPEGTRFTPERRQRVLEKLAAEGHLEALERAGALTHTLPPRPGGALAMIEAAPEADVYFVGHAGLEGVRTMADLLGGALVGRAVRVRLWRVPAGEIPADPLARRRWLYERWAALDRWVASAQ
jgi:1-acyl-sn-glycerol-3-phosphate acyltransferase